MSGVDGTEPTPGAALGFGGVEVRRLGRSGLRVSELALGTATWGQRTDPDIAAAQLRSFLAAGGTTVHFGGESGARAHHIVGTLLAGAVRRTDLVLVAGGVSAAADGGARPDASRGGLLDQIDAALRRLGTDHVDLWLLSPDAEVPFEESLAALDSAVSTGRVRYLALADDSGWRVARAATWQAAVPARAPVVGVSVAYSLLDRGPEVELVPATQAASAGVLAHSALGGGLLSGKYRDGLPADSRAASGLGRLAAGADDLHAAGIVEAVATAAEGLGTTPVAVALGWLRRRPGVASVVAGARTPAQLSTALSALTVTVPAEILDALDEVSQPDRPRAAVTL